MRLEVNRTGPDYLVVNAIPKDFGISSLFEVSIEAIRKVRSLELSRNDYS